MTENLTNNLEYVNVFTEPFVNERDVLLQKYPKQRIKGNIPFGYIRDPENPRWAIPDLKIVKVLDKALDQLDNGIALREATEWINGKGFDLSHMGLKKIWLKFRPDSPIIQQRKLPKKPPPKKLTREERLIRKKKIKAAHEKRKITFAKRRIESLEDEVKLIKGLEESPVLEIDYSLLSQQEIEEEAPRERLFEPNPGPQTEFLAATELEVLFGGAAGGGKSYALITDPLRYFGNKNFNGLLLRRTNSELRDLVWETKKLYPKAYPGAEFREKDSEWRFPSGARFWMSYLERDEDILRYIGHAYTWIGIDELTQYATPKAWNMLRSRLRTSDPELSKCLSMRGTTNPGGPGHAWVKKMFVDPAPPNTSFWATNIDTGETLINPKTGEPLFKRRFIPSKLKDNPYLAETDYEANLLSLPEDQRRQYLEGDWNVADGAAFPEFREKIHVFEPFDIPKEWRRFRSCDYGYSSATAVHWYAIDPDGGLIVYRELYTRLKTGKELAKLILDLEKDEKISYGVLDSSLWSRRGDPGPSIAETMIANGCRWRPSDRSPGSRIAGKNRLHELLKVDPKTSRPGIIFFNNCRNIISNLPVIPMDPDGGDDIDDRYMDDHSYDSIRYGIMTRPRPGNIFDEMHSQKEFHWEQPSDSIFGY